MKTQGTNTKYGWFGCAALITASLSGCATGPSDQESTAIAEINQARGVLEAAAKEDTRALTPGALKKAQDKLDQAQQLARNKKYQEAAWRAEEASVDAELALELAESQTAQDAAQELIQGIETLRDEMKVDK